MLHSYQFDDSAWPVFRLILLLVSKGQTEATSVLPRLGDISHILLNGTLGCCGWCAICARVHHLQCGVDIFSPDLTAAPDHAPTAHSTTRLVRKDP